MYVCTYVDLDFYWPAKLHCLLYGPRTWKRLPAALQSPELTQLIQAPAQGVPVTGAGDSCIVRRRPALSNQIKSNLFVIVTVRRVWRRLQIHLHSILILTIKQVSDVAIEPARRAASRQTCYKQRCTLTVINLRPN